MFPHRERRFYVLKRTFYALERAFYVRKKLLLCCKDTFSFRYHKINSPKSNKNHFGFKTRSIKIFFFYAKLLSLIEFCDDGHDQYCAEDYCPVVTERVPVL